MRKAIIGVLAFALMACESGILSPRNNGGDGDATGPGDGDASLPGTGGVGTGSSVGTLAGGTDGGTGASSSGGAPSGAGGLPELDAPLIDRLGVADVSVAAGVQEGVNNWRVWTSSSLHIAPVYTVPTADCGTLVCYTSGALESSRAHVVRLDSTDKLVEIFDVGDGFECRGLAAEPSGHFAVLLWNKTDRIFVQRFDSAGVPSWSSMTELTNDDNKPDDFTIGESRFEYGDGKYGAYYHVHSDSGHEGDTLKYVDASTGSESTDWSWGCSHSMSEVLRHHPTDGFLSACVTDCFPGTDGDNFSTDSIGGIYLDHNTTKVLDVDAGCNGSVAGELGSAAIAPSGWKLVFNAHQQPAAKGQNSYESGDKNQDIGFSSVSSNLSASPVVWLTNTPTLDEEDSSIARLVLMGSAEEQYLVGWREQDGPHKLALVSATGSLLGEPEDVSSKAQWGKRSDAFRRHVNDDVVWAWFDSPGSTTLHFARVDSGGDATCTPF